MALEDRDYMRPGSSGYRRYQRQTAHSVLATLIVVNMVVGILNFLAQGDLAVIFGFYTTRLYEIWRPVTALFLHSHSSISHLLMNMIGLWLFGGVVQRRLGGGQLLRLYLFCGVLGNLLWLVCNLGSPAFVIGASGSVCGLMVAAALLDPDWPVPLLGVPVKIFCVVYLVAEVWTQLAAPQVGIAHLAHLGGMIGGFLVLYKQVDNRGLWHSLKAALTRRRPRVMRASRAEPKRRQTTPRQYREPDLHFVESEDDSEEVVLSQIDPILDKIGKHGMSSLTARERVILDRAREKLKKT